MGTWRIRRWEACFPQPPAILQTGRDHLDLGRDVKGRLTAILKSGRNLQGSMLFVGTWPKSLSNSDVTQVSERSNGSGLRLSGDAGVLSTAGHNACGTTRPRVASDCLLSAPEQRTLTTIPSRDCKGGETEVRGDGVTAEIPGLTNMGFPSPCAAHAARSGLLLCLPHNLAVFKHGQL